MFLVLSLNSPGPSLCPLEAPAPVQERLQVIPCGHSVCTGSVEESPPLRRWEVSYNDPNSGRAENCWSCASRSVPGWPEGSRHVQTPARSDPLQREPAPCPVGAASLCSSQPPSATSRAPSFRCSAIVPFTAQPGTKYRPSEVVRVGWGRYVSFLR